MRKTGKVLFAYLLTAIFFINGLVAVSGQAIDRKSFARGQKQAETIQADWLRDYLSYVASDEMEGRDTPSRGLDLTAKFIALHLKQWGVKPAGDDGTYFQKIALQRKTVNAAESFVEFGGKKYVLAEDFLAGQNVGNARSAPLIFMKNGWVFKAKNINPYQNTDVRGKVVVMSSAPPKGITQADFAGTEGVDYQIPVAASRRNGALGVIEIPAPQALKNWKNIVQNSTEKGVLAMEKFVKADQASIPSIAASAGLLETIFAGEKINGADLMARKFDALAEDSFALSADKKISINVASSLKTVYTQNVVGMVEGSDAKLKNEYVALGAHYDHVGTNQNAPGADKIWNGADDDGSGTVSILAMAKALATAQPRAKRSALFVWHAGEEKGLWGAKYFSEFPTVPQSQIIAQLNIDMIGRSRPATDANPENKILVPRGEIYVIGSKKMSSELGAISESVNDNYLKLKFNYKYDDLTDPNRFFYRSDHFHYARKGIPIIFYFDGTYEDYHQPSDEVEKIDFEQMQMVARTIFMTGWELLNAPNRPKVDKPLSAEEAVDPF
jgi:hypothetical protein